MADVDQRIVKMSFENKDFEKNANQTISTLDKLKEKLNFEGLKTGLEKLGDAFKSWTTSPLEKSLDTVTSKFTALDAVAFSVINRMTNAAIDAGEKLVKNLSVDQISAGWQKYADKTTAVQTIMAATSDQFNDTGKQMEYVNEQLDRLNWFTDETSYNFVDMVGNIGKFTSNDVQLADAVNAMEGIAGATALAGGNAQSASRVMYNLSQALGAGAVKLQDWMSVENANVATKEFKETLIQTAKEVGTLNKQGAILNPSDNYRGDSNVNFKNFRNTLSAGWLTSDVLIKALDKYGSFATRLSEISLETDISATEFLQYLEKFKDGSLDMTKTAQAAGISASTLNKYLKELSKSEYDLGYRAFKAAQEAKTFTEALEATKDAVSTGWLKSFEIMFGDYEHARVLWTDLANNLWDLFASTGEARNAALQAWADKGGQKNIINSMQYLFDFILSYKSLLSKAFYNAFPELDIFEKFSDSTTGNSLKNITQNVEDFLKNLIPVDDELEIIETNVNNIFQGTKNITSTIGAFAKALFDVFGETIEKINFTSITTGFKNITEAIKPGIEDIDMFKEALRAFVAVLSIPFKIVQEMAAPVASAWKKIFPEGLFSLKLKLFTQRVQDFGNSFKLTDQESRDLTDTFQGLFSVVALLRDIFESLLLHTSGVGTVLRFLIDIVLKVSGSIGRLLTFITSIIRGTDEWRESIRRLVGDENYKRLSEKFDRLGESFDKVKEKFKSFFENLKKNETITKVFDALKDGLTWLGELALDGIIAALDWISSVDLLGPFRDENGDLKSFSELIKDISEGIAAIKSNIESFFNSTLFGDVDRVTTNIKETKDTVNSIGKGNFLSKIANNFKNSGIIKFFDSFNEKIGKLFENLTAGKIIITGIGFGAAASLMAFASAVKDAGGMFGNVGGFFKEFTGTIKQFKRETKAEAMLKIAGAIAILALSLGALTLLDSGKLKTATACLGIMIGALTLLTVVAGIMSSSKFSKSFDQKKIKEFSNMFVSIASSMAILSVAMLILNKVGSVNWMALLQTVSMLFAVVLAFIALNRFSKDTKVASFSFLMLATSLFIFVAAIKKLSEIQSVPSWKIILEVAALIASIGVVAFLAKSKGIPGMLSIISFVLGLWLLKWTIEKLTSEDIKIGSGNALGWTLGLAVGLGVILTLISSLTSWNKVISKNGTKTVQQTKSSLSEIGSAFLKMSISLLIIAKAMQWMASAFNKIDEGQSSALFMSLLAIFGGYALVIRSVGKNDYKGASKVLLSMALSIAVIAVVISLFSLMMTDAQGNFETSVLWAYLAIASIMGIMVFALQAAKKCQGAAAVLGTMAAVVGIIGILMLLFAGLSGNEMEKAMTGVIGVEAVLFMAMSILIVASNMKKGNAAPALATLSSLTALIAVVGTMMLLMKSMSGGQIITIAASFIAILFTIAAVLAVLNDVFTTKSGNFSKNAVTQMKAMGQLFAVLSILLISMSVSMMLLAKFDFGSLAGAFGSILILFTGVMALMAGLAMLIKNGIIDEASLKTAVESIAGVLLSLLLLIPVFTSLAKFDFSSLLGVTLSLSILLLVVVGAIAGLAAVINQLGDTKNIMLAILSIALVFTSLLTVLPVFNSLAKFDFASLLGVSLSLGILLLSIVVALALMNTAMKGVNAATILKGILSIVAIVAVLLILTPILKELVSIDLSNLALLGLSLAIFIGELVLVALLCGAAIEGILSLAILSAALLILLPTLEAVANMDGKALTKNGLAMAGLLLAMALVGIVSLVGAPGLMLLGIAFIVVGLGILFLITPIMAGISAFNLLTNAIARLMPYIPVLNTMLTELGKSVAAGFYAFLTNMLVGFKNFLTELVNTIPYIIELGFNLLQALLDGIEQNLPAVVLKVTKIVITFLHTLQEAIPDIVNAGFDFIIALITGIADAMEEKGGALGDAIANFLIKAVKGAISAAFSFITTLFEQFWDWLFNLLDIGGAKKAEENAKKLEQQAIDKMKEKGLSDEEIEKKLGVKITPDNEPDKKGIEGILDDLEGKMEKTDFNVIGDKLKASFMNMDQSGFSITPVLDTSTIQSQLPDLNSMLEENGLTVGGETGVNSSLDLTSASDLADLAAMNLDSMSVPSMDDISSSMGNTINFTQINNSPKALDRYEIYRDTQNNLSLIGKVNKQSG